MRIGGCYGSSVGIIFVDFVNCRLNSFEDREGTNLCLYILKNKQTHFSKYSEKFLKTGTMFSTSVFPSHMHGMVLSTSPIIIVLIILWEGLSSLQSIYWD